MLKGNLMPAYGRKYTSRDKAVKDWEEGKDFIYLNPSNPYHGQYCSIRDFKKEDYFQLRFGRYLQNVVMVRGSK